MAPPEPVPMRSMRVMTSDIRYTGVTYAPFTAALPSEQSTASESSSGRPTGSIRRGKILGPDTPPADESPIGGPWILAVFAILFAGFIAWKNKTTKELHLQYQKNNSTMKNKPSIQSARNRTKVGIKSVVNATKVLSPILLFAFLTLGVGQAWGYNNVYLSGEMNSWGTYDYGTSGNGTYYIYTKKNQTFKFKVSSYWRGAYGSSAYSITIGNNYTVCDCDGQNFKYTGNTGIVAFSFSQTESGGSEWKPNISLARPTIYIRHNWDNAGWSNQSMTDNNDGTYKYDGIYSGSNATNIGPCSSCTSGSATFKYITSATLVGSPETGDKCRFVYNSSGYKGEGSESLNTGSLTITKLCKITYNGNGKTSGTLPSAQSDNLYNTSVTLSSNNLTKTGYTHTGWNTEADGTGTHYNKGASITVTEANLTLYAEWTPTTTTITLSKNAQGGSTVTGAASVTATYDAALPPFTALTSTNDYALTGYWTSASGGTKIINANGTLVPNVTISTTPYTGADGIWKYTSSTLTLHAQWSLDRTLTYDGNGATSGTVPAAATSYPNGTSVTVLGKNTLAKTGYTFSGWNTAANGSGTAYAAGASITMNANYTLFAQWSENKSSVSIAASPSGAGTFSPASPVLAGVDTKPNVTATAVPGYKFSSWAITGGATISSTSTNPTTVTGKGASEAATLTANFVRTYAFIEGRFHITNSSRDGSWINTFNSGDWDENSTRIPFAYDETNHEFYLRTYATPKELSTQISNYDPYFFIKLSTSSSSVSAADTYRPNTSGASNTELSATGSVNKRVAATPGNSSHSYKFNSTDESGYVKLYFNQSYIWYWLEQTLEYNANEGTGSDPASKAYYDRDKSVQAAANTYTRDGYTFTGWNTKANGSGTAVAANEWFSITANTTLYAQWSEITHTVSVASAGNGTVSPASVSSVGKTTTSENITATAATGYYFTNWTLPSGVTAATSYSTNSNPIKINATADSRTIIANFALQWSVVGDDEIGGWTGAGLTTNMLTNYAVVSSKDKGYVDITLLANKSYKFKVYDKANNKWYGYAAGDNEENQMFYAEGDVEKATTLADGNRDIYLNTAAGGTYHFKWNLTDKYIAVEYPTSRFFTIGKSIAEAGSLTAVDGEGNTIQNGEAIRDNGSITFTITTVNTGYEFVGWYSNEECTTPYTHNGSTIVINESAKTLQLTNVTADLTKVYAKFVPKTYTVTLTQTGAASAGTASVTASYNADAPTIATLPTAANGYAFMGYYSATDGEGTQFVQANGTWNDVASYISGGKWIYDDDVELFAYFKKAEITAIALNSSVLDPVDAGGTGWVIANPTVEPTPVLPVKICWELLYDNDNPVPAGHEAQAYAEEGKPNQVRFSIAGLAASRYKIKATLRTGSSCDGGDELSTRTQTFTIASSFTVNILYQDDDGNTIAPGTTSPGKATDWTTISAPDIFGYTFDGWNLGEGITTEDPTGQQNDFRFKASYYGTIIAKYEKNQYIYLNLSQTFSASGKWNNPYVYFYNGDPWVDNKGAGAKDGDKTHTHYISGHAMTKIDGTDIWYFDYGGVSGATSYVAFTWGNQTSQENFWHTDVIFRGDFSESTPLFVPATDGTAESRQTVVNDAQYYNKGYWVTYLGEATGYTLLVYNSAGNVQLKSEPFIAADKRMTMTSTVQLDASSNYKLEVLRNDGYYYNKAASNFTASSLGPKAIETGGSKYNIQTNADGIYTFTLGYNSGNLQLSVVYPSGIGDFRIAYTDNATWSHSHTLESWILPSKTLAHRANGIDTVSFFISKGDDITPKIRWEKVTAVSESSVTWGTTGEWLTTGYTDVSEAGVYNFKVTQNADGTSIASIERIGEYDGSYYIRCNALRSKWDHYTIDSDHRMTYSEFSESAANSFGEKYSHYKAKWCPRNTNIAFVIANDYSPCLTDKLTQDVGGLAFNNLEADGTLKYEKEGGNMKYNDASAYLDKYSANVRFMWNRKTNKISRAYVSAATSNNAKFLVLQGSGTDNSNIYNGTTGYGFTADPPGANSVILKDDQNWIYEVVIKANPSALVKLYANYCDQIQWFRGADGTPFEKDVNAVELLGGSSSSSQYAVRVIYDFKTNRLVCAWIPEGASQEIETNLTVNADVMVIREHQGPAQCITFANDKSMTGVKTVYGAMKFNRWILSNRAHPEDTNPDHCRESNLGGDLATYHSPLPIDQQLSIYERSLYFISFPFDVKASEIFGFGHYWDEWYLEYYDGKTRAKNGYWIDSPANWKYVTPEMLEDFTLKANEGYILGLDLDFMKADNTAFWSNGISTVELYFPSTVNLETLQQTNVTIPALSSDYKCTINRGTPEGDRRVKDSYWRCLGVPSFNIYNSALKDGSGNTIEWKTDYTWHADESEFPFIYMWNKADNTLTAQSTSAFNFLPMHAYLVQNGGEINWTAVSAKPSSIVARQVSDIMPNEYNWRITLSRDSVTEDQTYVRMTSLEQVTDSFDFGQDLVKELNTGRSDIYTFIGYERVAANSRPIETTQTTIVPMGLNIETTGDYTFSIPEGTDGVGVVLVDEATGIRTSLSALDYTVTLQQGDYTNRFYLEISPIQNTPTGIDEVPSDQVPSTKIRKVMIDGVLYIVRDGKIFDARGARVE